ncbi:MAG: UDP-N-acetylmuramoyl-tripeptide--D-alanyl-D-alanine ligase [Candidatus Adiutrix sp.]|jgi:UDP-N-acetylmuramoyl-tripeptide--D-alanyl-D-alanine ligase|nr:UDP-N-acetylmuramoyl-tripeptide--D-alanyl-D-alanine ligase [Candidatus Adiutrix sp.]
MKDLRITLGWLADSLGAVKRGAGLDRLDDQLIAGISTDSRTLKRGEIFVALAGANFDGHNHAAEAQLKGALAVVAHQPLSGAAAQVALTVTDTLKALGDLARALRRKQQLRVTALTGSNGKTTTKEMLASILRQADDKLLATRGNFNNLVGLPLTLLQMGRQTRQAVLEMGMNRFGEIARLTAIAEPEVALITSVGAAHLEFLGDIRQVARAKGELFSGLGPAAVAVVDADQPLILKEARRFKGSKLLFGIGPSAQVRLGPIRSRGLDGQTLALYGPGAEKGRLVKLQLLGEHNAHNALAAGAAALAAGADWDQIVAGLEKVEKFPGRLAVVKTPKLMLLDDSYNANPTSMAAGLRFLGGLKGRGAKGAILGDMGELGRDQNSYHRAVGRLAAQMELDFLALVGPLSASTALGARRGGLPRAAVAEFATPEEAAEWVARTGRPGSTVLVKGSRYMHLERAVDYLRNLPTY